MLVIDRFEGDMAVIEYNGKTFDLPRSLLPEEDGMFNEQRLIYLKKMLLILRD